MNVVEAYIKFKGHLVIFISGLSGCGKTKVGRKISKELRMHLIEQFDYYKKDYAEKVKLSNGKKIINWSTDEAIDWDSFNKDIDDIKHQGVVVVGFALPDDKMTSKPNFHIHLSISLKKCFNKRRDYLKKNQKKYPEEYKLLNTNTEKLRMNTLIYPYYNDSVKKSRINKFVNTNKLNFDQTWNTVWDLAIYNHITPYIKWFNEKRYSSWLRQNPSGVANLAVKSEMNSEELKGEDISPVNRMVKPIPDSDEEIEEISEEVELTEEISSDENTEDSESTEDSENEDTEDSENEDTEDSTENEESEDSESTESTKVTTVTEEIEAPDEIKDEIKEEEQKLSFEERLNAVAKTSNQNRNQNRNQVIEVIKIKDPTPHKESFDKRLNKVAKVSNQYKNQARVVEVEKKAETFLEKIKKYEENNKQYATKRSVWDDDDDEEKIKDGPIVSWDEYIEID